MLHGVWKETSSMKWFNFQKQQKMIENLLKLFFSPEEGVNM